jgi:glutathione S-transferase
MGMISPSPFSVKSLALLELSGLPYTRVDGDPRRAPKRKLPVLEDAGRMVPDSHMIQRHLAAAHGIDLDAGLSPQDRAVSAAFRALIEDQLYWVLVHSRWIDNPEATRAAFFAPLPAALRPVIFALVQRQVRAALHGQGMGRHDRNEIYRFGTEGIGALAGFLGDRPYLMGDRVSAIDTSLFGFLENVLTPPLDTPLKAAVTAHPELTAYHRRFEAEQVPGLRGATA